MTIAWDAPKDPDEVKDYSVDWSLRLGEADTITASAWSIVTADTELVIDSDSFTDTITTVWLSAGVVGTALLLNRVQTDGGRTYDQTGKLKVKTL